LMQLPHFTWENVKHCKAKKGKGKILNTKQFLQTTAEERKEVLRNFSEEQMKDVEECIKQIPHFDIEHSAYVKGDDEDVNNELYGMCLAREKVLYPETFPEEDDDQLDEDGLHIEEELDDSLPRYLPRQEVLNILRSPEAQKLGFKDVHIRNAFKEMESSEHQVDAAAGPTPEQIEVPIEYSNFVKIAAKQVLEIHAMDAVTVTLDRKFINAGTLDVHCPNYPCRKKCAWFAILGDPAKNRLINYIKIGDINKAKPEDMQIMFQPDKPGKLEYEVHLKCDSYGGLDIRFPLRLNVLKAKDLPPQEMSQEFDEVESDQESSTEDETESETESEAEDSDEDDDDDKKTN